MALLLIGMTPAAALAQPPTADSARSSVAAEIAGQVSGKLKDFYSARGYWPVWIDGETVGAQADDLLALIETSQLDGLDPRDYDPRGLRRAIEEAQSGEFRALARAELALSRAFAALVEDMRRPARGATMRYLDEELEPRRADPSAILRQAALAPSFADYVHNAEWMSNFYMRLRHARALYDDDGRRSDHIDVPTGRTLKPGMSGADVEALRERLGLHYEGGYDRALAARVRRFQAVEGLKDDGVAGPQTLAALNRDPGERRRLLAINLERARLLPGPWVRHVVVDAASARLWYYSNGALDGTMKVVVGAPDSQTPMMAGMVRYATLNPYWNIPSDLVERTVAPRILRGASLVGMKYEALSDWSANPRRLNQSEIDWQAVAAGAQEVRVRQLPGGNNAMGQVKFMFPNDLGIYLHDTPARDLFARPARQFSNGCVRLEDAQRLGRWFFGERLASADNAPEQHRPLPQPVPVYLTYFTAVPEGDGVRFIDDVYGRDGDEP
ncbi:L,D-transpeptidase family protein [Sphingobium sp. AN641]|uniref:L,D-transpeptidase family protein n=1 Tax=Sphingobium sp. AN641 TaxID=3133443 RepID=UPI0030C2E606